MEQDMNKIFNKLEQIKLKPGETLKTSYFKPGGQEPLFVITDKIDGTFTLYSVVDWALHKVQTAASIKALENLVLPALK